MDDGGDAMGSQTLFRDYFDQGSVAGWTFVDEGTPSVASCWEVVSGGIRQTSNVFSGQVDVRNLSASGTYAIAGKEEWTDYVLTVRVSSADNDAIGVMFRYIDDSHYYRFSMDRERGYRRLVKKSGARNHFTLLWEDAHPYVVGREYQLVIIAIGRTLRGFIDGVLVFSVEDDGILSGCIGLYCCANSDARFAHVRVVPADQALGAWSLREDFSSELLDRWQIVDHGDKEGPSVWEIRDGELWQISNIHGGLLNSQGISKPGACILTGDADWDDYRLSVRLSSDDDDGIGAFFRYRDPNNFYRFSMDRERSFWRLVKTISGNVTVLSANTSFRYSLHREYVLTIDCIGHRIAIYLDGVRLCSLVDPDLPQGRIGLYCWGNTGARFKEVLVAGSSWIPYREAVSEPERI